MNAVSVLNGGGHLKASVIEVLPDRLVDGLGWVGQELGNRVGVDNSATNSGGGCSGSAIARRRRGVQAELGGAGRPCAPTLTCQNLFGDCDLLFPRSLAGEGGVLLAAVGVPGGGGELEATVVAIASVDCPVATGLALCETIPVGIRGCGSGRGQQGGGGASLTKIS